MTSLQQSTANQIISKIQKFSPWATEVKVWSGSEMYGIPNNNIILKVSADKETYADVQINSNGKVVKGKWSHLNPIN
jgi:hypothetical protein